MSNTASGQGNMTGALIGSNIGAFCWVALFGVLKGIPWVTLLAVGAAILGIMTGQRLFRQHPERRQSIIGLTCIWGALANLAFFAFINLHFLTGPSGRDLDIVNLVLFGLGLLGIGYVIRDLFGAKRP